MTSSTIVLCILGAALAFWPEPAVSEPTKFEYCDAKGQEECGIANFQVNPCPEAAVGEPCKIKRGKSATLTYNFTPHWAPGSGTLKTRAFWATFLADLPFLGMDTDVCKYSTCPYVKDQENFYNFTLSIDKKYIAQRYDIKFKIWEENAEPKKECCLVFKLKLV